MIFKKLFFEYKSLYKNFLIISSLLIIVKLTGLFKEIYLARTFGLDKNLDAYYLSLSLVTFIPAALVAAIPPILVPYFSRSNNKNYEFLFPVIIFFIFIGAGIGLLINIFSFEVTSFYLNEQNSEMIKIAKNSFKYFSILPILIILISVFSSFLIAKEKSINSLLELIPNFSIIIIVFFLFSIYGYDALVTGHILGIFLQCLLLILISFRHGLKVNFFANQNPSVTIKNILTGMSIILFGQLFMTLIGPIDNSYAVNFGDGSLAAYNYANRFIAIIMSLSSVVILRVLLPRLSKIDSSRAIREAVLFSIIGFILSVFVCLAIYSFIDNLILLAFGEGKISNEDKKIIIQLVEAGILQIPFFVSSLILVQVHIVKKKYAFVAIISLMNLLAKYISNIFFVDFFGMTGLMLAWALMYATSLFLNIAIFFFYINNDQKSITI